VLRAALAELYGCWLSVLRRACFWNCAARLLSSIVYQATSRDPLVLAGVVLAMLLLGLVATWIPAAGRWELTFDAAAGGVNCFRPIANPSDSLAFHCGWV